MTRHRTLPTSVSGLSLLDSVCDTMRGYAGGKTDWESQAFFFVHPGQPLLHEG